MMNSNYEDKCFVCSQTGSTLNIFSTYNISDTKEESYVEVIKNCFDIEITVDSGLKTMCSDCSLQLTRAYCLKNDVVKAIHSQVALLDTNEDEKEYSEIKYEFDINTVLNPETGQISYTVNKIDEIEDVAENVPQSYLIDLENDGIMTTEEANKKKAKKTKRKRKDVVKENISGNVENVKPKTKRKNNKKVPNLDENLPKVEEIKDSVNKPRKSGSKKIITIEGTVDELEEEVILKKKARPNSKANLPPPFTLEPGQLVCKDCGEEYDTTKALSTHMNLHYPDYVCADCGMAFASQRRLRVHRNQAHVEGPLACKYCDKQFSNQNTRNAHMWRVHTQSDPYKCSQCDERFKTYLKRLRHVQTVHGNAAEYQCQYCDKKFAYAAYRTKHVRTMHLQVRPHKCPSCPYTFARRRELDAHRATKHGDGDVKYQCDVCEKKFYFKTALKFHMSQHKDVFACNQCDAKFPKSTQLEAHNKSHDIETQEAQSIENILPILEPMQFDCLNDYALMDTAYWALSEL